MVEINLDSLNNNNSQNLENKSDRSTRERNWKQDMVRLPNLINRTLFRAKKMVEHDTGTGAVVDKVDLNGERKEVLNIDGKDLLRNKSSTNQQTIFEIEDKNLTLQNVQEEKQTSGFKRRSGGLTDMSLSEIATGSDSGNDSHDEELSGKSTTELQEQIKSMKRSFLFEQNHQTEKFELEKFELRENYEEEKTRLKKAFENEKTEFLKEIERKDKMLQKLAEVLKKQYERDFECSRLEFQEKSKEKTGLFLELSQTFELIIQNTGIIVENNKTMFASLNEFDMIKESHAKMSDLLEGLQQQKSSVRTLNESILHIEHDLLLTRSISDPEASKSKTSKQQNRNDLTGKKCPSFDYDERSHDEMQHEMASAYRKQKTELVKLFNTEQEEDKKRLDREKNRFERDVRTEYESRMSVERKAWQDTIEDLEREIKILKYEREQLDRNYCLGMDEVRTEFEKEKQEIYKRYSEAQSGYEGKLRRMMMETNSADIE